MLADSESRIKNLMWTNGSSRAQYKFFGDMITFDTTYLTNLYDMLFGLFLKVLDVLGIEGIPKRHIVKRWTKDVRDILPAHLSRYQKDQSVNQSFTCRSGTLHCICRPWSSLGWGGMQAPMRTSTS